MLKRDNKVNFSCDFGQLLHQFILLKVHIISDKNVWDTSLKLSKSCPNSQQKIILLPRYLFLQQQFNYGHGQWLVTLIKWPILNYTTEIS